MHPHTPPVHVLEKIKKELLNNKKRTKLEEKKLMAVTFQLEDVNAEIGAAEDEIQE